MQVELLLPRSGAVAYNVGDRVDLPDGEARRLIEAGKARPVAAKPSAGRRKKAVPDDGDVEVR